MFNSISWTDYITTVVLLLMAYYVFVGIKFYSLELRNLFSGKNRIDFRRTSKNSLHKDEQTDVPVHLTQAELFAASINSSSADEDDDIMFQQVGELTAKLKEAIAQAVDKNFIKEELLLSLQLVVKKYAVLKGSHFQLPINNLIASECEKYGYIQLSAEERLMLWNE